MHIDGCLVPACILPMLSTDEKRSAREKGSCDLLRYLLVYDRKVCTCRGRGTDGGNGWTRLFGAMLVGVVDGFGGMKGCGMVVFGFCI